MYDSDCKMAMLTGLLCFGLFITNILAARDCTDPPPDHVKVECVIAARGGRCHRDNVGRRLINVCSDRAACLAWTGIDLIVSCEESGDGTPLSLYHKGSTQGFPNVTWTFAEASVAEGLYECRDSNGTLFANRSIVFDEAVYVIPGRTFSYDQFCERDIVPEYAEDYHCNVPRRGLKSLFSGRSHTLYFNILGTRPISIDVEVLWANHYPVDLGLSYDTEANGFTTLHNVTLDSTDIVHIGQVNPVSMFLAITALHNGNQSSTMCVQYQFFGGSKLFPNESLPSDLTTKEGSFAEFACEVGTGYEATDSESATVSFLVQPPESPDTIECLNCSLTPTELSSCTTSERCFNLKFSKSSLGGSTHRITATWSKVKAKFDGYRVACALAVNGVTQWKKSATLTVEPAPPPTNLPPVIKPQNTATNPRHTPFLTQATNRHSEDGGLSDSAIAGISVGVVLIVVSGLAVALIAVLTLLFSRRREGKPRRLPITNDDDREN